MKLRLSHYQNFILLLLFILIAISAATNMYDYFSLRNKLNNLSTEDIPYHGVNTKIILRIAIFKIFLLSIIGYFLVIKSKISFLLFVSFSIPLLIDLVSHQFRYYLLSFEPSSFKVALICLFFLFFFLVYISKEDWKNKLAFSYNDIFYILLGTQLVTLIYIIIITR